MRGCFHVVLTVDKRGRARGLFGWLRGHPWAVRRLQLDVTYTTSTLQYFKDGDILRDLIDLMGCTCRKITDKDIVVDGRSNGVEITLATGENLYFACNTVADQDKVFKALEFSGLAPTIVDSIAEKMNLQVLMKDHERCLYSYIHFKGTDLPNGLDPNFDPSVNGIISLDLLNQWQTLIESTFGKLYTKSSEIAGIEDYHQQEFNRKMEMHKIEADGALQHGADPSLANGKMTEKVFRDKVVYVMEKERRLLEHVKNLVNEYL